MGEIKINSIKNEMLKGLAEAIDQYNGDKNGAIDTEEELSIFAATTKNKEYADDTHGYKAELDEILGLEKSQLAQTATLGTVTRNVPEQPAAGTVVTGSAINSKEAEDAVKKNLKYWIKNGARPNELVPVLRDRIKDSSYQSAINDVEQVLALVNATNYNSKADVKAIESKVKPTTKFQKEVLKELVKQAEMEQIIKEKNELTKRYNQIKEQNKGTSYFEYAEQLKKDLKGSNKWKESYTKEAFDLLKNTDVRTDAIDVITADIQKASGMKDKEVRNNTKANYTDKKVKKVVDKEFKEDSKVFARKNKTEAKKVELTNGLSRSEIEKIVGKDTFEILKRNYLANSEEYNPHILPNGKYDLSELSDVILNRFGANYYGDREDRDDNMAEFKLLKDDLKVLLKADDISDDDVKDIIKLCAFELQGKDRSFRYIANRALFGLLDAVGAAAGAASAALLLGNKEIINYYTPAVNVSVNVTTKITAEMAQETCNVLKEMGLDATFDASIEAINKIDVHIPEEWAGSIDIDHSKDYALKSAAGALALSILTNALTALIFGGDRSETSCMSVSDYNENLEQYTDPDKFKKYFAKTTQNKQKITWMNALVDTYVKQYGTTYEDEPQGTKGKVWHKELHQDIIKAAGVGSKLNPEECRMFFKYNQPSVDVPEVKQPPKDEPKQQVKPKDDGTKWSNCKPEKVASYHNGDNYQWADLARMYKCLDDYDPGKKYDKTTFKARFMKVLQGISDKNYDFIRIVELTKKSLDDTLAKRGQVSLKNEQGFDYGKFMKFMGKSVAVGDDNKDVIAPLELTVDGESNCSRDITRLGTPTPYEKKGGKNNPQVKIDNSTEMKCEYTISDKSGTRKVTKEEYQKSTYKDITGQQ